MIYNTHNAPGSHHHMAVLHIEETNSLIVFQRVKTSWRLISYCTQVGIKCAGAVMTAGFYYGRFEDSQYLHIYLLMRVYVHVWHIDALIDPPIRSVAIIYQMRIELDLKYEFFRSKILFVIFSGLDFNVCINNNV